MADANILGPDAFTLDPKNHRTLEAGSFRTARRQAIEQFEAELLTRGLQRCGNNISELSKQLSLDRRTLQRLMQKHQIPTPAGVR
jgi:ActR/RegA family two-component response regulator